MHNRKFYFDDFKHYIENKDSGELEEVQLDHADFEKEITNQQLPDWKNEIPLLTDTFEKRFAFKLVKDDPSKNNSPYIEGKNIQP